MATTAPAAQDPASSTPPPEEVESPATHQEAAIKGDADAPPAPETPAKKKVTATDIQLVQNLIERCLQLYMSQKEVEAAFTDLVWQKLEEQNPDFFRSYYTRLKLKDQIVMFNHVLEQQVSMVQRLQRAYWMPAAPNGAFSNGPRGSHLMPQPTFYVQPPPPLDAGDGIPLDLGGEGLDAVFPPLGAGEEVSGSMPVASLSPLSPELSLGGISSLAGPQTSPQGHSTAGPPGPNGLEMPLDLALPRNFSFSDLHLDGELPQQELLGLAGGPPAMHRDFSLGNLLDIDGSGTGAAK